MVKPVKPKVGFIAGAVLVSAIESLLVIVGGLDGGRGAGRIGVRLLPILPRSGHKVKRKFLIAEIRVLNADGGAARRLCATWNLLYTMGMILKLAPLLLLLGAIGFADSRVFELRTYTCYDGKLDALKARFRDHTIRIFKKHGIESVGYFVPQDGERSKNTLIYILAHPSREAATKNWADFVADPEWKKVAAESEANGKIVQKIESVFMEPTEFSQLK